MFTKKAKDNLQAMLGQAKFSAANNTDAQALRVPSLYPEWEKLEEGTHLEKGQRVNYNNVLYNVLSAHDKQTQLSLIHIFKTAGPYVTKGGGNV